MDGEGERSLLFPMSRAQGYTCFIKFFIYIFIVFLSLNTVTRLVDFIGWCASLSNIYFESNRAL